MPEGHTLHRRARDHSRWFGGQTVRLASPQGRFSEGARILDQCRLDRVFAIGKHLLYAFDEGFIHVHLGLFGKFRVHRAPPPDPRDTVRLRLAAADRVLDLTGPTACELWTDTQVDALRKRLGPDPLDPKADPERMRAALRRRTRPIGAVLLDQSVVAGVGNVYRAELLFRAGLDPTLPARDLTDAQIDALWADMVALLALGVKYDRIITVDPEEAGAPPQKLGRRERLYVYKRPACRRCDGPIASGDVGNRTLYWCPSCQTT